jgi:hypothetical protein
MEAAPIIRYYVWAMETFANPDEWSAREAALGTMVSYSIVSNGRRLPHFIHGARSLLQDIGHTPARVTSIRLLWEAGTQRIQEPGEVPTHDYDSLVVTISPKNVVRADCLGVINQYQNGICYMRNAPMPRLRKEWVNYIVHCIMVWSTILVRPEASTAHSEVNATQV